ncbi:MAG: D-aminoacylase [Chloroflexi bacterium]|nr:D-aminoacylase [Chloroflexota bacterium]
MDLDAVVVGALVIDGTGALARPADVGIRAGRISLVTEPGALSGADVAVRERIDGGGRVLAPGFIDIHTHSDVTLLDDPGADSKVQQGVTTEVTGNCSYSPFPIGPDGPDPMRAIFGPELDTRQDWDWTDLDGWATRLESNGIGCNLAPLVGHSAVRIAAGLGTDRAPAAAELASMVRLVAGSIEQGAFGLSTGLTLTPSSFATTDEIVALTRALQPYPSAFYATHARVWAGEHVHALQEAADIGRRAGVPVQFSHIAIIDARAYGRTGDLTDVIDGARAGGQDMTADVYPYTAGGTHLMQFLPEWVQDGGVEPMLARMRDVGERTRVRASAALGWFRGLPWDWDSLVISDIESDANRALVGRSIADAAGMRGEDPLDTFLGLIDEEDNRVTVVCHNRTESDMQAFLRHPMIMIGSDGTAISPSGPHGQPQRPHPRYYGTYPRILGRYVRDGAVLGLEAAIHKMTGFPAARLGLTDRGRIAEGCAADLVLFDPATIIDRATFEAPHQFPAGIDRVMVNGVTVVRDGVHSGARPGRVLRRGVAA